MYMLNHSHLGVLREGTYQQARTWTSGLGFPDVIADAFPALGGPLCFSVFYRLWGSFSHPLHSLKRCSKLRLHHQNLPESTRSSAIFFDCAGAYLWILAKYRMMDTQPWETHQKGSQGFYQLLSGHAMTAPSLEKKVGID